MSEALAAGPVCRTCRLENDPGARFCGGCGAAIATPSRPTGTHSTSGRIPSQQRTGPPTSPPATRAPHPGSGAFQPADQAGGTTRFLAAAVHLDADLAEGLMTEFLSESRRSIPRSPGVDAAAVLGDAAASHRRRQIRDIILLLLALVAASTYPTTAFVWVLAAVALSIYTTRRGSLGSVSTTVVLGAVAVGGVVLAIVSGLGSLVFARLLAGSRSSYGYSSSYTGSSGLDSVGTGMTVATVIGGIALVAIPAVLLTDQLLVVSLIGRFFSRAEFRHQPDSADSGVVAALRRIGRGRFSRELERTARAESGGVEVGQADVVLFRGEKPFVGAGEVVQQHSMVIPLERDDEDDQRPPEVSEQGLHRAIHTAMGALRRRSSLSPHARLEGLTHHEQVLVSAYDLVAHWPSAEAQVYLPQGLRGEPAARLPVREAQQGIVSPREWARYYQCFRVEGWEQDLTVSCHITLGTDGHLLYLEWATCALAPLDREYRVVDDHHALTRRAWSTALAETVLFPTSLWSRLRRSLRSFTPMSVAAGQASPDQYGALVSLRELAAGPVESYFHVTDVERYAQVFDRSVLEAVRTYLEEHGLQLAEFDRVKDSMINVSGNSNSIISVGRGARSEGAAGATAPSAKKGSR